MADRVYALDSLSFSTFARHGGGGESPCPPSPPSPFGSREIALFRGPRDVVYKDPGVLPDTHPSYNKGRRRGCSFCCHCLAWALLVLVVAAFVLALASTVIYLVLQPRVPRYDAEDVQIREFAVKNGSEGQFSLESDVLFTIRALNPNERLGIYYHEIKMSLKYKGVQIGNGSIPAFYQGHKNSTLLKVDLQGHAISLDKQAGLELKNILSHDESISLEGQATTRPRFIVKGWEIPYMDVPVICYVQVSSPSSLGGARVQSKSCEPKT